MNLQSTRIGWLLVVFTFLIADAYSSTVHNFDAAGTPYTRFNADYLSNHTPATVMAGGPTGNFLRLATVPATNLNTIAFNVTDKVAAEITAEFDFRMTAPPNTDRNNIADGFGFALLDCSIHGINGAVFSSEPENAGLTGSLGVGFHIYHSNSVSVAFNGKTLTNVDVTPTLDLASGQFIHARIVMRPGGGFSDVTVILTPPSGTSTIAINQLPVPGFVRYLGRVWFGARSGGLAAEHDVDNINVQFNGVSPDPPFVQLLKSQGLQFVSYSPTNFDPRIENGVPKKLPDVTSITEDLAVLRPAFDGLITVRNADEPFTDR